MSATESTEIRVIGAGWGRTGTHSFKDALEILGMPCYHMVNKNSASSFSDYFIMVSRGANTTQR